MAQGSSRVREVRAHLRQAAALLGDDRFSEALAEVDAALLIDPGFLPAQALRDRVRAAELAAQQTSGWTAEDTAGGQDGTFAPDIAATTEPGRFVPPGVNAQSWIGFEQRIQERRFRALLESVHTAMAHGDGLAARVAFEEARELRPDAPELDALSDRVLRLPMAAAAPPDGFLYSRAAGAVLLLLLGVSLLIGFERLDTFERLGTDDAGVLLPRDGTPALAAPADPTPRTLPPPIAAREPVPELRPANDAAIGTAGRDDVLAADGAGEIEPPVRAAAAEPSNAVVARPDAPTARAPEPQPDVRASADAVERRPPPPVTSAPPPVASANVPATGASERASDSLPFRPPAPPVDTAVASGTARDASVAAASLPTSRADVTASVVRAAPADADALAGGGEVPAVVEASAAVAVLPENDVVRVLNQYATRSNRLDASGVRELWPSAPERLARAFADLESQAISFDGCDVDVDPRGTRAVASCHGSQSFVARIGSRERRTEMRQWQFDLRRDGEDWRIEHLQMR